MKEYFMFSEFDNEEDLNDFLDIFNAIRRAEDVKKYEQLSALSKVPRMPRPRLENPIIDQEIAELARHMDMSLKDFQDVMREDLKGRG